MKYCLSRLTRPPAGLGVARSERSENDPSDNLRAPLLPPSVCGSVQCNVITARLSVAVTPAVHGSSEGHFMLKRNGIYHSIADAMLIKK